ncbi:MAG: hypothetical protein ABH862_04885 [Candidatus Omnitrophota bacterium]
MRNKKKHILSCEVGGSIYAKRDMPLKKNTSPVKVSKNKRDLVSNYSCFYKEQVDTMDRIFRKRIFRNGK